MSPEGCSLGYKHIAVRHYARPVYPMSDWISEITHVRTSPYYPQSNGKFERWHCSLKRECIRPKTPLDLADARQLVDHYVTQYNCQRLHSAIGYVMLKDKLEGREMIVFAERKPKLKQARDRRKAAYRSNFMKTVSQESVQIDA